jgi:hypothetical protein
MANERYEDKDFVEEHQLPAASQDGVNEYFVFIFRHKASQNVFQAIARDRDELAAKILVGDYKDADRRNTRDPGDEETEDEA